MKDFAEKQRLVTREGICAVFEIEKLLPPALAASLRALGASRADYPESLSEIRLRACGVPSVVLSGENLRLGYRFTEREWDALVMRLFGGAMYAHRDTVAKGYVSLPHGVRVGVAADVRYDGGRLIGARAVGSLVFRLPTARSERADELYRAFMRARAGMLIYSLPGGGKTSALRALSGKLGALGNLRVVVVDERREFCAAEYKDALVDILSGYKKAEGIEIAGRCMSAEVIIVDEIGNAAEAEASGAIGYSGVPIIATAHADSLETLLEKRHISELVRGGYFSLFAGLYKDGEGNFGLRIDTRGEGGPCR